MVWTLILVPVSILGVWLAAHHWYGWAISLLSEALWAAYAVSLHSLSLLIMSFVWAGIHGRNTVSTYRREHPKRSVADWVALYAGIRVVTSPYVPKGTVYLIDTKQNLPSLDQLGFRGTEPTLIIEDEYRREES